MRKFVLALLVVAFVAPPAMAELGGPRDRSSTPIYTPTGDFLGSEPGLRGTAVYDSSSPGDGGYFAGVTAIGVLGYDDYVTQSGVDLTSMKFVGGMSQASGTGGSGAMMWLEFYDPNTFGFITSFGMDIPSSGWWIWTVTFPDPPFVIPHSALFQVVANSTFTGGGGTYSTTIGGLWFLTTTDALTIGANDPYLGGGMTTGGTPLIHQFRFDIPEPATLGLLGAGMLLVLRRRR